MNATNQLQENVSRSILSIEMFLCPTPKTKQIKHNSNTISKNNKNMYRLRPDINLTYAPET